MAAGIGGGIGRDILFSRGLMEWIAWFGRAVNVDRSGKAIIWEKYELAQPADELVVLLANMIQEAI